MLVNGCEELGKETYHPIFAIMYGVVSEKTKLKSHCDETPTAMPASRILVGKILSNISMRSLQKSFSCLLRNVWPWQRTPAEVVRDHEQIDQGYRCDAARSDVAIRWWRFILDHGRAGDLACRHESRAQHEDLSSTDPVREEDHKDTTCNDLDSSEDGSQKEVLVATTDKQLEVLRAEVCEGRGTSCLLGSEDGKGCETIRLKLSGSKSSVAPWD